MVACYFVVVVVVVVRYIVLRQFLYKNSYFKRYVSYVRCSSTTQGIFITFSYKCECFKVVFE